MENIHQFITEDIFVVLKQLVNQYEDKSNIKNAYIATVTDNNDPDGEGKIKAKIHGLFDDIAESDLPWCLPETEYTDTDLVKIHIPKVGAKVTIHLQDDDIYKPTYSNTVTSIKSTGSSVNGAGSNPDIIVIYENEQGDSISIDREQSIFTLTHHKGMVLEIDSDGFMHITQIDPNTKLKIGTFDINSDSFDVVRYNKGLKKTQIKASNDGSMSLKNGGGIAGVGSGGITVSSAGLVDINDGMAVPNPLGPFCSIPVCPISGAVHVGKQVAPGLTSPGAIL